MRLGDVADVRVAPTPQRHRARGRLALRRRDRQRAGARCRRGRERRRGAPQATSPSRSSTTPRCSATTPTSRLPSAAARLRHRRGDRHLPAPAGRLRELAPGAAVVPDAAGRRWSGGLLAALIAGGTLARPPGGLLAVLGIAALAACVLLIDAVPAPRAEEGEQLAPSMVDLAAHRSAWPPSSSRRWRPSLAFLPVRRHRRRRGPTRSSTRWPSSMLRRPGHVGAAQPVRAAGAVPAVRRAHRGRPGAGIDLDRCRPGAKRRRGTVDATTSVDVRRPLRRRPGRLST